MEERRIAAIGKKATGGLVLGIVGAALAVAAVALGVVSLAVAARSGADRYR